ncbi:hypothetical protein C0989_011533, partial [Termitomyces sp. Mn162]
PRGPGTVEDEMAAIRFVASQTSIPVPRPWFCFQWGDSHYAVMSRVKGIPLPDDWSKLPSNTQALVAEQLQGYVSQLRNILPPADIKTRICSVTGGPVTDYRLYFMHGTTGPFRDEAHMNLQLRWLQPIDDPEFPEIVRLAHSKTHARVFTHGDLTPRNIMFDPTSGKITAIVDWECAGWFPEHWEYCKAVNFANERPIQAEFKAWIPKIMPRFELEAKADRTLMYEMGVLLLAPTEQAP